jgi:hypothetical protein
MTFKKPSFVSFLIYRSEVILLSEKSIDEQKIIRKLWKRCSDLLQLCTMKLNLAEQLYVELWQNFPFPLTSKKLYIDSRLTANAKNKNH